MSKVKLEIRKPYLPLWKHTSGEDSRRYVIIMGGRGGGRSTAASQLLITKLFAHDYLRAAIMRSVQTDIRPSVWSELVDRLDEMDLREAVDIKENAMTMKRGKNLLQAHGFKASSGSNSAKLKSLASYNTVWIEEAEEISEGEFMKLDDSLRTTKGTITIILTLNTPAKNHWIIERFFDLKDSEVDDFYVPTLKKEREKDTLYIRTNYTDNKTNLDDSTIARYEEYKETKPDYYYQTILGLSPEVVRGKIFTGWRRIPEVPFEAKLERIGVDWGWFPDPLAIVAVYRHQGGYILDEVAYSQKISNDQAASIIKNYLGKRIALVIADSAEPKSVEELQSYGLNVLGAEKGPGSVDAGIKMMGALQISVTERSHNLWREFENYAWREDRDGNPLGVPIDRHNHLIDASTYSLRDIKPHVDTESRMERRMRRLYSNRRKLTINHAR